MLKAKAYRNLHHKELSTYRGVVFCYTDEGDPIWQKELPIDRLNKVDAIRDAEIEIERLSR